MTVITRQQRVAKLRKDGYNPIHLVGGFYLVRYLSVKSKKSPHSCKWKAYIPFYTICFFKEKEEAAWVEVSTEWVEFLREWQNQKEK